MEHLQSVSWSVSISTNITVCHISMTPFSLGPPRPTIYRTVSIWTAWGGWRVLNLTEFLWTCVYGIITSES